MPGDQSNVAATTGRYWLVAAVLVLVTAAEVLTVRLSLLRLATVSLLLAFAAVKGSLIVAVFMELKGDPRILKIVFLIPLGFALLLVLALLTIVPMDVGIAG